MAIAYTEAGGNRGDIRLLVFVHLGIDGIGHLEEELQVSIVSLHYILLWNFIMLLCQPGVLIAYSDITLQFLDFSALHPARVEPYSRYEQQQENCGDETEDEGTILHPSLFLLTDQFLGPEFHIELADRLLHVIMEDGVLQLRITQQMLTRLGGIALLQRFVQPSLRATLIVQNKYEPGLYSESQLREYCQINFTSSDESRPIVFDENGEAVLYLRVLPGVCDACFGVKCTVERGGVEMEYSKFANLETLGRSLTFKEGGLTKFSVELKPAVVASPTKLNYFVPKPRIGFTAYWQADPNAIGYECQYVRTRHYDYDTGIETTYPKVKLTPVKGSGDMEGMYYVEVPGGMEADSYVLGVRPIPNSDSGLCDFDLSKRTLYVGVPATTVLSNSSCEKITESIWKLTEMDDTSSSPWYLNLTNMEILGNDGSHWFKVKDTDKSWVISTCTEPEERQHIGEIHGLTLHMDNATIENTSEVYGLKTDGTSTKMSNFTRDGYFITYDFLGEGSFNGFRIKDSNVNKGYPNWSYIYIDYYPPEEMY